MNNLQRFVSPKKSHVMRCKNWIVDNAQERGQVLRGLCRCISKRQGRKQMGGIPLVSPLIGNRLPRLVYMENIVGMDFFVESL